VEPRGLCGDPRIFADRKKVPQVFRNRGGSPALQDQEPLNINFRLGHIIPQKSNQQEAPCSISRLVPAYIAYNPVGRERNAWRRRYAMSAHPEPGNLVLFDDIVARRSRTLGARAQIDSAA
jgi:hypothetical protein